MVMNQAAELLLLGAEADPRLFLRFASRGAIERFVGCQMAAHDAELSRCEGRVRLAAYAQGGAVPTEEDLCDLRDQ
jgi:hypothetical protein